MEQAIIPAAYYTGKTLGYYAAARTGYSLAKRGYNAISRNMPNKRGYFDRISSKGRARKRSRIGPTIYNARRFNTSHGAARVPTYITRNLRVGGYRDLEMKFLDNELTNSVVSPTAHNWVNHSGTNSSLIGCLQGDGESNRDGRTYRVHSVHVRGFIQRDKIEAQAAPEAESLVTLILYLDTQCNGAQPGVGDVMDNTTNRGNVSFRNLQHSSRFRILRRVSLNIKPPMMNEGAIDKFANSTCFQEFAMNYKFREPIKVITDGTTADVASLTNYNIGIQAVSTNTLDELNWNSRVRFTG